MIHSETIFDFGHRKDGARASVRRTGLAEGDDGAAAAGGVELKAGRIAPAKPCGDAWEEFAAR
jgi:hypothetical protein